ncbi:MAG: SDR family oxidoreductase [Alphaproteobacteria bacterium]
MNGSARVALITGASRGIGAATARLAAKKGYDVAVNYVANAEAAAGVVRDVEALGRRAVAIKGDVGREADILAIFAAVDKAFGRIDALVNNAGAVGRIGRVENVPGEMVRGVMDVNVTGALLCAREAVKRMSTKHGKQGGVIVNISSGAATTGSPENYVWYAASKAALDAITLGLGLEVAREGIRVVGLQAGVTETDIHATAGAPGRPQKMADRIPIGRPAQPLEMAEAILWLMSDAARYCTATTLRAGGGL